VPTYKKIAKPGFSNDTLGQWQLAAKYQLKTLRSKNPHLKCQLKSTSANLVRSMAAIAAKIAEKTNTREREIEDKSMQ